MDKYIKYEDIRECRFFQDERGEWILHADIIKIPAADVASVIHGKWINPHWQSNMHCMNCDQCKYEAQHSVYHGVEKYYHYCPNCGAKMDGDSE